MKDAFAGALMRLTIRCLSTDRRGWAIAMSAEYEAARADGHALGFAAGCLIASCRELPRHAAGRRGLADHVIAIGLLVPLACLQLAHGFGGLSSPVEHNATLASAQLGAVPALLTLWFATLLAHLRFAWLLLERDVLCQIRAVALIVATTLTLFAMMALLLLDTRILLPNATVLILEIAIVARCSLAASTTIDS